MPQTLEVLDHASLQRVAQLHLVARTVVESFVSGQHRSVYKGFSVEFAQHREYARGDEIRHIDWKVFAKSDRLFVKQYEEETNLRATLFLDASGSMAYGGAGETKFSYARKLAAALSYLMVGQSDSVGLAVFDTQVRALIPPRSSTVHLSTLLRTLADAEPGGETNLAPVLHALGAQLKRRGLVIAISDFFAPAEELIRTLALFRHERHEVILLHLMDPNEMNFPFEDVSEFRSLENSSHRIRLDAPRARKFYLESLERHLGRLREACHRYRFDHVLMTTDQPFDAALARYLTHRRER